jgi:type IV pilus assembly protein PilC
MTLNAGIPISHALSLTIQPTNDPSFTNIIKRLNSQVRSGVQLHRAMRSSPCFTPLLIQMTKTGEESGQLDAMLFKTADIMENTIERTLNRFSQLLEPLIMIVLGVLIGGLVTGMYLPIFKLGCII